MTVLRCGLCDSEDILIELHVHTITDAYEQIPSKGFTKDVDTCGHILKQQLQFECAGCGAILASPLQPDATMSNLMLFLEKSETSSVVLNYDMKISQY